MLLELHIKDFAIIDNLTVSFSKGLNILTGETGAGKSIIIDAVQLILGDRASNEAIRTGCEESRIEAVFDILGLNYIKEFLEAVGIEGSSDTLLIKRVISKTGKNKVFINSSIATTSILSELGKNLIDIYGQHEHQSLVSPQIHIDIYDSFAGLIPLREKVNESFNRFSEKKFERDKLKEATRVNKERQDFLLFQSHEIESANLKPDEDTLLKQEKEKLVHAEKLFEAANTGYEVLYGQTGAVIENIGQVLNKLKGASQYDGSLLKNISALESCLYQLEDISANLRDYSHNITFDPKRLEDIDNREDLINRLEKKYGQTVHEIMDRKNEIDRELESITSSDERIASIDVEVEVLRKDAFELAAELSKMRKAKAGVIKKSVESELAMLNMKKTVFELRIEDIVDDEGSIKLTEKGIDRVEFFISSNVGEEVKPLARIASGGELSRIMLALKRIAAEALSVPVLIFDEIDAGIGGAVAEVVGRKLKEAAKAHQVLCITHLPQIAVYADRHFFVSKKVLDSRTITEIKELNKDERLAEVARMLGGVEITNTTKTHAREMLENAGRLK
ncbi:MAG: DNA repair protein RecN [Deltaproteobacteria bacterium]|nr:DNA repair protein RecN [Deltaproteobacteria bacterium]